MQVYRIKEYGKIMSSGDLSTMVNSDSEIIINPAAFDSIWSYILEFQSKDKAIDKAFKLLTKNGKKQIQVQNYVGIIETKNRTVIEILPKIFSSQGELGLEACKKIFLRLVASSSNIPVISFQQAALEAVDSFPILEAFINEYVLEIEQLILRGLRNDYSLVENNSNFLKGQLLFSKDILKNVVDKSRFYIRHTQYQVDIPQNRIIKSTLQKLLRVTTSNKNEMKMQHLLSAFSAISQSKDVYGDLAKVKTNNRLFSAYEKSLLWSEIFLLNKGFTSFTGENINQAILFPMERLFEDFIAKQFKKYAKDHYVHAQDSRHVLVEAHNGRRKFRLKPDIYIEPKDPHAKHVIVDTKWKLIDDRLSNKNYLIAQSDMYQAYAYGRKYSDDTKLVKLALIYPMNNNFKTKLAPFVYEGDLSNQLELVTIPFDLGGEYEAQVLSLLSDASK